MVNEVYHNQNISVRGLEYTACFQIRRRTVNVFFYPKPINQIHWRRRCLVCSASVYGTTTNVTAPRSRTTWWHRRLTTRRNLGRGRSAVATRSPNFSS